MRCLWAYLLIAAVAAPLTAWGAPEPLPSDKTAPPAWAEGKGGGSSLAVTAFAEPETNTIAAAQEAFTENKPVEDFVVHFVVATPFTALFSYVAVVSLNTIVQGAVPTTLRPADTWVIMGLALGSSLAVALGSLNRVPDQSQPQFEVPPATAPTSEKQDPPAARLELVRMEY